MMVSKSLPLICTGLWVDGADIHVLGLLMWKMSDHVYPNSVKQCERWLKRGGAQPSASEGVKDRGAGPLGRVGSAQPRRQSEGDPEGARPFERHAESKMRGQEHGKGVEKKRGDTVKESSQ